jgi:uncharacterized protein
MARGINYGRLMQQALRQLIADVLSQVAVRGLPGEHHFFIAFDTQHPGVDMAPSLKARFPDEMTIVLQEWFTDLAVMKDRFTVTLNFGEVPETIVIPFEAIKKFVDPSVEFGLRFDAHEDGEDAGTDGETRLTVADAVPERHEGKVVPFQPSRKT